MGRRAGRSDTYMYAVHVHTYAKKSEGERRMNLVPGRLWCTKGKVTWYTSWLLICKARVRSWYVSYAGLKILWRRRQKSRAGLKTHDIENRADFNNDFFISWQSNRSPGSVSRARAAFIYDCNKLPHCAEKSIYNFVASYDSECKFREANSVPKQNCN